MNLTVASMAAHRLCARPDGALMAALDRGEQESIQLAMETRANVLIMDEWKGPSVRGDVYQQHLIGNPLQIRQRAFRSGCSSITSLLASR